MLIFVIMYFLLLRPQQKRVKQHAEMVKNVRKGDTVITSGGLVGRVTKVVDDDQIEIEIADGVRVRQMRAMVSDVRAKGEPVKDEDQELIAVRSAKDALRTHALFLTMESAGDAADGAARLPVRGAEFLADADGQSWPTWAQRHVVLGLDLQGGSHILLEVDPTDVRKEKAERCATTCGACCATHASAIPASWSAA